MKSNRNFNSLLEIVKGLPQNEQAALVEQIMGMMSETPSAKTDTCHELVTEANPEMPDCPHCAAKASLGYVVKHGKRNGVQRYWCKACGKHFFPSTNTTFSRTRKNADAWRKFIQMTISGASLRACAEECDLCYQTAFDWRHKVLNAFVENQKATNMTGTVEVDEMLIPISYKGNHIQGGFLYRRKEPGAINDMPRKGYKRGTDNISRSSKDKACVFCMVEDGSKAFYAAVPGVGYMNESMLNHTVGKHVNKETAMMLADDYNITRKYFENNGYQHTILLSNTSDNPHDHKPEVKNGLHIQHVNAMHHHIRTFLKPYCGVSSKYLEHYMALFVWLKNIKATKQRKTVDKVSVARAATPDCYITSSQLHGRPAVPACA